MSKKTTPRRDSRRAAPRGSAVWIVMQWNRDGNHEFQGVFASERRAVAACRTDTHCVCPAIVGVELGQATETWPGAWYPHLQPRPQNASGQPRLAGKETHE